MGMNDPPGHRPLPEDPTALQTMRVIGVPSDHDSDIIPQQTGQVWLPLDQDHQVEDINALHLAETAPGTVAAILAAQEPASELEGRLLGKFRLENEIARGGMGIILKSRDTELDREVAVKVLRKVHLEKKQFHQQFQNEVRITGRLQHPGIIPIYETGVVGDGRPFFVMKLIKGQTLAALLNNRTSVDQDLPRLLKIFEHVCQTLSYTHSRGIIHLDIKPTNIMVGTFGEVHLMDWGLARSSTELCNISEETDLDPSCSILNAAERLASRNLQSNVPDGTIWGTPAYMSPEQARGHCTDVRSDVFGLGGILCEILTGSPPHSGESLIAVCFRAAKGDLSHAFSRLADCQADGVLVRLATKCLSAEPDLRPADASLVAGELTLYLDSRLQRAETDLERFFDLSLDLFCIAGLDGYFRRVNSNFPRVLGYSEKALVSRPFMNFVHPEDRDETIAVMSMLLEGKPVVQFQNRYLASDGSWKRFEWTAKSIPKEGIIFAVARDVTDSVRYGDTDSVR